MLAGYSFRPRAWALVLAAAACAAGIALGNWQTRRAAEKQALGQRLEQSMRGPAVELPSTALKHSELSGRRVVAHGTFLPERTVFLDNKVHRGRLGYEVITPLKLANSSLHLLVNRGWIAAGPSREALPEVRTPPGTVRLEGLAQERLPHALSAGGAAQQGRLRQNLDLDAFAAESGLELQPFFLQQRSGPEDGLARDWPRPDVGMEKHQAYALQWYSLAALAVVLALVLSFQRVRKA
jgi:surfeit locus 1 family protein